MATRPMSFLRSALTLAAVWVARAQPGGGEGDLDISSLPLEKLAQILALELQQEDKRPVETIHSFNEFQDMTELDCGSRLLLLMNRTLSIRNDVRGLHQDVSGVAGLMMQVISKFPDENTWIWLAQSARSRVLRMVHGYLARLASMSLDRQDCLMTEIRQLLLEAVVQWKELHRQSLATLWSGYAFGQLSGDPDASRNNSAAMSWSDALVASDAWLGKVRTWLDTLTEQLYLALQREVPDVQVLPGPESGGAMRLHHQDEQGMFVQYEYFRRRAFNQWALDKGLLRGLIRHVWRPGFGDAAPMTLGDFGAGGGQYSAWLNETGLVQAFAFDGTKRVTEITGGSVNEINLIEETHLWRTFDWVMCLEVGEHIPSQYSKTLLQNLKRHAVNGLVMSWSDDWEGIGHVNCMPQEQFIAMVERETGFQYDPEATKAVKESCEIDYIARTVAVFRVKQSSWWR
eukprot:TRINITY_DN39052_c0_g1_i1.p1 TRINITY_DN39052_c0_g1~~TRINITY_DN39052_c0_g1_i1.p1  ORF type:complete len:458 (-),score=106.59 TRINITY_DN39052_c0_g1_i1:161-1534(-)